MRRKLGSVGESRASSDCGKHQSDRDRRKTARGTTEARPGNEPATTNAARKHENENGSEEWLITVQPSCRGVAEPIAPVARLFRESQATHEKHGDDDDAGTSEPGDPVRFDGQEQAILGQRTEHEAHQHRRTRPLVAHERKSERSHDARDHEISERLPFGKRANERQEQQKGNEPPGPDLRNPHECSGGGARESHGEHVSDDHEPHECEDEREVTAVGVGREQPGTRYEPLHHERTQQDRAAQAARNTKSERWHQRASERCIVGG